ncbi:MAG: hypothetical protein AAF039_05095 [Bacteroidota bacterium]
MKNWNNIILFILFLSMGMTLFAQRPAQERIKTFKVAFITERLSLTSGEAEKFWPVYNTYEEATQKLRRKEGQRFGSQLPYLDDLSETEASKLLSEFRTIQVEKHELEQQFLLDLEKVLPAKKIALLLKAEEDFKKRLLQRLQKRRNGG